MIGPGTADPAPEEPLAGDPTQLRESYRHSLALQEMRISALQAALDERRLRVEGLEASLSWRVTGPMRLARSLAGGRLPSGLKLSDVLMRARDVHAAEGTDGLRRRLWRRALQHPLRQHLTWQHSIWQQPIWRRLRRGGGTAPDAAAMPEANAVSPPALLRRSVLIIAELSVPQCAKYRVWQKQELLGTLGWPCTVVDWHETQAAWSALQCCTHVIFYRVPARDSARALIMEARRLGLRPFWEVDDLIFDEPLYLRNSNLASLAPSLRGQVLSGIRLYREAMLACDRAIASTPTLARHMREAGVPDVTVVQNALDNETLATAESLRRERRAGPHVTIVYGSGTKTHDADFAVAAPAIARLMRRHAALRLTVIGDLALPAFMDAFRERILTLPGTNYRAYLGLLSEGDIAIAPLEAGAFNDAKSNIKFQEAAILGMPTVASPRAAFTGIVSDGDNGLLAETGAQWEQALDRLVREPALRARLGGQALRDVLDRYAPQRIAETELSPLVGPMDAPDPARLRVLMVNVFLWPRSFGGATIVAEQMARRLHDCPDTDIAVFTSRGEAPDLPEAMLRYDWDGIPVFAAPLPEGVDHVASFDNPAAVRQFAMVLDAWRPDVVHAHSVQGLGAGILRLCQERGVAYVVTLHDAWWLCDRQFMVRGDGRYCFQNRIDLRICQACVPHARHLHARAAILRQVLDGAAHLLSPSESHRRLYLANGIAGSAISVNRNGTRPPGRPRRPRQPGRAPRFGFVGGNEAVKGFGLVRGAFESLESDRWELVLVDNTLNLGFSSIDVSDWKAAGRITILPAYGQEGLDGFFEGIDVLLFPSQWKESYGLSVREALARDVWVIATSPGGQSEDIEPGVNGTLIALDGRVEGLTAAIEDIVRHPQRLDGFANPHASRLADYDSQARHLHDVLARAGRGSQGSRARSAATRSLVNRT